MKTEAKKEYDRLYSKKYRQENQEKIKAYKSLYRKTDAHKTSSRKHDLKKKYGISIQEYEDMLLSQDGACAICGSKEKLVIDHDHTTGKVRGLLCDWCNKGIGLLKDSVQVLEKAIRYISK